MGKRKKGYYIKSSQGKKGRYEQLLQCGMRGFLITCGNRAEKDARREAYSILNEYADKWYGPEKVTSGAKGDVSDEEEGNEEEEEDVEKALKKEVEQIKKVKTAARRFQAVEAGANNCIFIKTTLSNPAELLSNIVDDLHTTKIAKSRYIMKIFPVIASAKCDEEKIKKVALECFEKAFKDIGEFSYYFNFKIRNNTGMTRAKVLPIMCEVFTELGLKSTVDYDNPDYVVNIDIIKAVCCFSVMKDFSKYRKYNLQEIVSVENKSAAGAAKIGETSKEKEVEKSDGTSKNDASKETTTEKEIDNGDKTSEGKEVDKTDEKEDEKPVDKTNENLKEKEVDESKKTSEETEKEKTDENNETLKVKEDDKSDISENFNNQKKTEVETETDKLETKAE